MITCTPLPAGTRISRFKKLSQLLEGGDNSSYAMSEAREVFINTSSGNSGVNK